jgi:hypothetical protein
MANIFLLQTVSMGFPKKKPPDYRTASLYHSKLLKLHSYFLSFEYECNAIVRSLIIPATANATIAVRIYVVIAALPAVIFFSFMNLLFTETIFYFIIARDCPD